MNSEHSESLTYAGTVSLHCVSVVSLCVSMLVPSHDVDIGKQKKEGVCSSKQLCAHVK